MKHAKSDLHTGGYGNGWMEHAGLDSVSIRGVRASSFLYFSHKKRSPEMSFN